MNNEKKTGFVHTWNVEKALVSVTGPVPNMKMEFRPKEEEWSALSDVSRHALLYGYHLKIQRAGAVSKESTSQEKWDSMVTVKEGLEKGIWSHKKRSTKTPFATALAAFCKKNGREPNKEEVKMLTTLFV